MSKNQPTTSARIPSYRLHRASGQAVVTIKGQAGHTRDVYLGKHDTPESHIEYQRVISEWRSGRVYVKPETPQDITVIELCASFLDWADGYYRKGGKPTSEVPNIRRAIKCVCECFPDLAAREFSPLKLMACQQRLIADGLCRSNVNRYSAIIVRIFEHGIKHEMIPSAYLKNGVPTATIDALRSVGTLPAGRTLARETEPIGPVSDEHVEATLPYLEEPYQTMVKVQLLTAMRPGELCDMSLDQIDRTEAIWIYRPRSHKTQHHHKGRIIPIGPKCQLLLRPFLPDFPGMPLWRNAWRRQANEKCYAAAIARACRDAGIPAWSPNQLRHAAATKIRKHHDLEAAQVILGHSNMNTTEIYAERNLTAVVKIAAEVG